MEGVVGSPRTKFFWWIPRLLAGNSWQNHYLSRGGRVLAVRGRKNPLDGNNSRIPYSEGSLPHKHNYLKFKHENMKNKLDLAILRPSNLFNEMKKSVTKSRETIPFSL
jgi:hypothetical protein